MLRRHLNRKQVRELIAEQLKDTPSWANNRIAQVLGTDSKTVTSVREKLERTSEIPKFDKLIGADGKTRPVKQKRPAAITASNVDELRHILERIEDGANLEDIQGFMSALSFTTIQDDHYDPFAHCDGDGKRAWHLFILFLVRCYRWKPDHAAQHIEWVLQRQFRTPEEWLGEEGRKFRRNCFLNEPSTRLIERWQSYSSKRADQSLEDIGALLAKEHAP